MNSHSYIRVRWKHNVADEPVDLWSELDERRFETRKVELWDDGRVGFADATRQAHGTKLGDEPVPPLSDLASQEEFDPEEIDEFAFEQCWSANVRFPPSAD